MRYGLIGRRLGHSYSKYIHEKMVDDKYDLIPLDEDEFDLFMREKKFAGINVTIPYKERVLPYLDDIDALAMQIGAVNTIINRQGRLIGYNTDFYGLLYLFNSNNIIAKQKKCLILGAGGTAKTAWAVLEKLGAGEIYTVSRNPMGENQISYDKCYDIHSDSQVIVNTTPVGMYPNMDASPLDLSMFSQCMAVVDVIFNPTQTKFTKQAEDLGILAVNGLPMLVAQAKQAEEYFRGIRLDQAIIDSITLELLEQIS